MGRISREAMFMEMARIASKRSTCSRLNVGALVVMENNPISVGWNGAAPKEPHCAGNDCPGMVPGKCPSIHAEANALRKAASIIEAGTAVDLYVTHSPCGLCSLLIQNSDLFVRRILFEVPYRSTEHLAMFKDEYPDPRFEAEKNTHKMRKTGIYEVTPAGYIVEYFSREVVELI